MSPLRVLSAVREIRSGFALAEPPDHPETRVDEFDGLRALLAFWVLAYHVFSITLRPVPAAFDGGHAVGVFFALSGFAIAARLVNRREPYVAFVVRRFLRLFPAYAICVSGSAALVELGLMPRAFEAGDIAWHAALHATMLHGALPTSWLPGADRAFLNPAWSVSVEWQFYLVAPMFFFLRRKNAFAAWLIFLTIAVVSSRVAGPTLGLGGASLLQQAPLFMLGVASYFVHAWALRNPAALTAAGPTLAFAPLMLLAPVLLIVHNMDALIWLTSFGMVLSVRTGRAVWPVRWLANCLRSGPLTKLGALSYALYLAHEPLVWLTVSGLRLAVPALEGLALTASVGILSVSVSIAVAKLLHTAIELPCIQLGNHLFAPKIWRHYVY